MKRILYLLPVLAGVFWGSVGIFVRVLTDFGMDNYTVLGSRMAVASVILFFVIFIYDRELLRIRLRDLGFFLGTGLCGMVGLNYCYNEAINQLTLSLAAVLLSLSPIFVMILSAFLFHRNGDRTMGAIIFNGIFHQIVDSTIKKYIAANDVGVQILTGAVIKMN